MDPTTDPRIPRPDLERRVVELESQIREMANERLRLLAEIVDAGDRADDATAKLKGLREKARALLTVLDRFKSYEAAPADVLTFCGSVVALRAEVES